MFRFQLAVVKRVEVGSGHWSVGSGQRSVFGQRTTTACWGLRCLVDAGGLTGRTSLSIWLFILFGAGDVVPNESERIISK